MSERFSAISLQTEIGIGLGVRQIQWNLITDSLYFSPSY